MFLSEETMFATLHQQLMMARKVRNIRTMQNLLLQDKEARVAPAAKRVVMEVVGPTQLHPLPPLLPAPLKPMLTEKL